MWRGAAMETWRAFVAEDEELVAVFPSLGLGWLVVERAGAHSLVLVVEEGWLAPVDRVLGWWFRPALGRLLPRSARTVVWVPPAMAPMGDPAWLWVHERAVCAGWWLGLAIFLGVMCMDLTFGMTLRAFAGLVITAFLIRGFVVPALGPWMAE